MLREWEGKVPGLNAVPWNPSMPLLSWFNRDADLTRAALAPYRLLVPNADLSHGEADSPNMLIQGDNLDALKALLWAKKSAGKGLYLMAQKKDEQGRGVREQLLAVIGMS